LKGDAIVSLDQGFYKGVPRFKIRFQVPEKSKEEVRSNKRWRSESVDREVDEVHLQGMDEERAKLPGVESFDAETSMDAKAEITEEAQASVQYEELEAYEEGGHTWKEGWVSFCDSANGIAAERFFVLAQEREEKTRKKTGKIRIHLRKHKGKVSVTVKMCKGLKKLDLIGANDDYVKVTVNEDDEGGGLSQRTTTLPMAGANPVWNKGKGEVLKFEGVEHLNRVHIQCFDEDEGGVETDDLIGECNLPLDEIIDIGRERKGKAWQWEGWRVVREPNGQVANLLPDHNPLHLIKALENKGRNLVHVADHIITDAAGQLSHAADVVMQSPKSSSKSDSASVNEEDMFDNPLAASLNDIGQTTINDSSDEPVPLRSSVPFDLEAEQFKKKERGTLRNPWKKKHTQSADTALPGEFTDDFDSQLSGKTKKHRNKEKKRKKKKHASIPPKVNSSMSLGDSDSV
jgi:hypothetical protein